MIPASEQRLDECNWLGVPLLRPSSREGGVVDWYDDDDDCNIDDDQSTEFEMGQARRSWLVRSQQQQKSVSSYSKPPRRHQSSSSGSTPTKRTKKGGGFFVHVVLPTDTLQGICLAYGIKATKLRQVNQFSGTNLVLAPPKLLVPLDHVSPGRERNRQDGNRREVKVYSLLADFPRLSKSKAEEYLFCADWDLETAASFARVEALDETRGGGGRGEGGDEQHAVLVSRHRGGDMAGAADRWLSVACREEQEERTTTLVAEVLAGSQQFVVATVAGRSGQEKLEVEMAVVVEA